MHYDLDKGFGISLQAHHQRQRDCIFCDSNLCFVKRDGNFLCIGCDIKGFVTDFYSHLKDIDIQEARKELKIKDESYTTITEELISSYRTALSSWKYLSFLTGDRYRLSHDTLKEYKLGRSKILVIIPVYQSGICRQLIQFNNRQDTFRPSKESEQEAILYPENQLERTIVKANGSNKLFIVDNPFEALSIIQKGYRAICSSIPNTWNNFFTDQMCGINNDTMFVICIKEDKYAHTIINALIAKGLKVKRPSFRAPKTVIDLIYQQKDDGAINRKLGEYALQEYQVEASLKEKTDAVMRTSFIKAIQNADTLRKIRVWGKILRVQDPIIIDKDGVLTEPDGSETYIDIDLTHPVLPHLLSKCKSTMIGLKRTILPNDRMSTFTTHSQQSYTPFICLDSHRNEFQCYIKGAYIVDFNSVGTKHFIGYLLSTPSNKPIFVFESHSKVGATDHRFFSL